MNNHLLYSYRRCPYAMRARMALLVAQIQCDVYEVDFKNKPHHMLEISPKGTVPVLHTLNGEVIDESIDIVRWALNQNDPHNWHVEGAQDLIFENDTSFKAALDRYKYPNSFPEEDCTNAREQGLIFLEKLNEFTSKEGYLIGCTTSVADICIFPFVRQFANVNREWFDALELPYLKAWLYGYLEGEMFQHIMRKHKETSYLLY